jgi:DNA polymerase III epsilon subunit-like protein
MPPVWAVEIAGQRMRGWEADGASFRVLLNHDIPIDPMAESVHGYSREYLRSKEKTKKAHKGFHDYAEDLPIVAYNIGFDWNRVLEPEYKRLHVPQTGKRGFCALTLARLCRRNVCGRQPHDSSGNSKSDRYS